MSYESGKLRIEPSASAFPCPKAMCGRASGVCAGDVSVSVSSHKFGTQKERDQGEIGRRSSSSPNQTTGVAVLLLFCRRLHVDPGTNTCFFRFLTHKLGSQKERDQGEIGRRSSSGPTRLLRSADNSRKSSAQVRVTTWEHFRTCYIPHTSTLATLTKETALGRPENLPT